MNELKVIVNNQLGKINFNFEELKDNLSTMMEAYEGAEFTEETSNVAKKESATLKKIKKALSDRRIEIKNEFMKPYDDFEVKVKELTALIDKPITLIDTQVKVFDEKKKAEKKEKIKELYAELIGELEEFIPLAKIYNVKWENISTSMKSVQDEMDTVISSTEMAVSTIKGMNSEVTDKALAQFKQDLSLANAISYINKHEQIKADILAKEEVRRKEEEERKRIAEDNRIKELEKQKILDAERNRIAEEERIRDEERKKIENEERIRREEREKVEAELLAIEKASTIKELEEFIPPQNDELEDAFEIDEKLYSEKPFEEEPFDVLNELPFVTVGEIRTTFDVIGNSDELDQVGMFLNSIGLIYKREDK